MAEKDLALLRARAKAKLKLRQRQEEQEPEVSKLETIGRAAQQQLSGGFSDEAQPFAQKAIARLDQAQGAVRGLLGDEEGQEAAQARAEATLSTPDEEIIRQEREDIARAEAANPKTALATRLVAGIPQAIALSPLGPTATAGIVGATQAAGEAEGDVLDRVDDALIGGTVGIAIGKGVDKAAPLIVGGASKVGSAIARQMGTMAEGLKELARKASTKAIKLRNVKGFDLKSVRKLADKLIDKKVTSSPAMLKTVNNRLKAETKKAGSAVKDLYKRLDKEVGIEDVLTKDDIMDDVINKVAEKARTADLPDSAKRELENYLEAQARPDQFKPTDLIDLIRDIEADTRAFDSPLATADVQNKRNTLIAISKELRKTVKGLAAKHFPGEQEAFKDALESFALMTRVTGSIDDHLLNTFKASSARLPAGSPIGEALRKVGDVTVGSTPVTTGAARTFTKISESLAKGGKGLGKFARQLQDAAKRGPKAVAATHFVLLQREPEYQEKVRKLAGEE